DHIHGWLEDWLQCEWWDWRVYTANITDQYVQIGVAGPEARNVLDKLGGMDLSEEELPFMSWKKGILGGHEVQVYRISFSGELSFEISVRASEGLELWEKIHEAGQEFSIEPYGTEALHVLRAEKGFIMIGDETDGTIIPQDLGLDWAISKKKDDFLGKRGQQRSYLTDPDRWKLVGLEVLDNDEPLPHGVYAQCETKNEFDHPKMEGRVTSTYYSPILKRPIAMGLVERGTERMGEVIKFNCGNKMIKAKIVSHIAYNTD
ncbi:MAG: sarcosine oxidase subunit alpha family protein, partial [Rhodobacteraceae bacterium]|nr:sarcosine oxidase subunit alpha family protein [Paracoccaceae bacterium]